MTPEERAKTVLDTFYWGAGFRAGPTQIDAVADAIREAVAAEKEACAQVIEQQGDLLKSLLETDRYTALIGDLARAIRART